MSARRVIAFLFPSSSTNWLAILRVGLGIQVIFYCLSFWPDWISFFISNGNGLINRDLTEAMLTLGDRLVPRLGWLITAGSWVGLSEKSVLSLALGWLFLSGCCLLVGFFSRAAAISAWFLHLAAVTSGGLMSYGVDNFMTIALFYLMFSPFPDRYSLDWRWTRVQRDSELQGFFRRVLQLHLCIIYFFGGLDKCLGFGWWNGTSIWRALTRPPFNVIPAMVLVRGRFLLPLISVSICLLEVTYPIFIWPRRTRLFWLGGAIAMHLAIGLTMGMYLFAFVMIVLNLAAFGPELPSGRIIAPPEPGASTAT